MVAMAVMRGTAAMAARRRPTTRISAGAQMPLSLAGQPLVTSSTTEPRTRTAVRHTTMTSTVRTAATDRAGMTGGAPQTGAGATHHHPPTNSDAATSPAD